MKIFNKKEDLYNINFEVNFNEKDDFFELFKKYLSLANKIEYVKAERSVKDNLKMARNKDNHLKEILNVLLKSKEGEKLIKQVNEAYNETFTNNSNTIKKEDKEVNKQVKKVIKKEEPIKIIEEETPFKLLKKAK